MDQTDTAETKKKQTFTMVFNIAIMISSFIIALIALPLEIFFVVAVIILFAIHEIEKDLTKSNPNRFSVRTKLK